MNKKTFALVMILSISLFLLFKVGPVSAAEKTTFPSYSVLEEHLDLGTWSYPDGNIHIRGMVQLFRNTGPDPRITGYNTVIMNANWQSDFTGPMSGTFYFKTDEGGLWEGTWAGQMTEAGPVYTGAADGYGMYAGMKLWVDMNYGVSTLTILEH